MKKALFDELVESVKQAGEIVRGERAPSRQFRVDALMIKQLRDRTKLSQPKFAILDETDSGLDADAVRLASQSIAEIGRKNMGLLIITHHDKLLEHNPPEFTHVILGGRIVETGGVELANELHTQGYDRIRRAYPEAAADNTDMTKRKETVGAA